MSEVGSRPLTNIYFKQEVGIIINIWKFTKNSEKLKTLNIVYFEW